MSNVTSLVTKTLSYIVDAVNFILCLISMLVFNVGFYVILYQTYQYLRYGAWPEMTLMYLVPYGPNWMNSWLNEPTSWLGLHELTFGALSSIPLSLFLIVVGGSVMLLLRIEGASCFSAMGGGR